MRKFLTTIIFATILSGMTVDVAAQVPMPSGAACGHCGVKIMENGRELDVKPWEHAKDCPNYAPKPEAEAKEEPAHPYYVPKQEAAKKKADVAPTQKMYIPTAQQEQAMKEAEARVKKMQMEQASYRQMAESLVERNPYLRQETKHVLPQPASPKKLEKGYKLYNKYEIHKWVGKIYSSEKQTAILEKSAKLGCGYAVRLLINRGSYNNAAMLQLAEIAAIAKERDVRATGTNYLGEAYFYGLGVEEDYPEAIRWLIRSLDLETTYDGTLSTVELIAIIYASGKLGVKTDLEEAYKWAKLAQKGAYAYDMGSKRNYSDEMEKIIRQYESQNKK